MGVMMCNRGNCENILCDRYSSTYGCICNDCFEELLNSGLSIEEFMETDIDNSKENKEIRRKFLEEEFKKD